ncbi:PepSY-like domain-containing protein [Spirosoma luteolum]
MKTILALCSMAALVFTLNACSKSSIDASDTDAAARLSAVASSVTSTTGAPHNMTAVTAASLPAAITTYITANYAGASVQGGFIDKAGNYVVVIVQNSLPKLLAFKANGTFQKELELRGKGGKHMHGDSLHKPKPDSAHLGRPMPTTIAVSSLPAAITTYISTNYAGATIERAAKDDKNGFYLVGLLTSDKKRVGLVFNADGSFKAKLGR